MSGQTEQADETTTKGAPHGITLFDQAAITAEIAEGAKPLQDVLKARGFTEAQWNESTIYWMQRIGDDVQEHGKDARVPIVYGEAFGKAQDALKPAPNMDAEAYAKLVVEIQRAGGPAKPLAARGLSVADYTRLARHWARVLSSDKEQADRFAEVYEMLQVKA